VACTTYGKYEKCIENFCRRIFTFLKLWMTRGLRITKLVFMLYPSLPTSFCLLRHAFSYPHCFQRLVTDIISPCSSR